MADARPRKLSDGAPSGEGQTEELVPGHPGLVWRGTAGDAGRYLALFERSPVGIAEIDLEGRLVAVNPALSALLGAAPGSLVGRAVAELTHPDHAGELQSALGELFSGEVPSYRSELHCLAPSGEAIWVAFFATAFGGDGGETGHVLAHFLDITDRRQVEDQLLHVTRHDSLTGLLNRRGFEEDLDRQAARVERQGPTGALLVLDLDGFQEINDTLGHGAGDTVLQSVAEVITRWVRSTDVAARLGGDEFGILLPYSDRADAEHVAAKLLHAIEEHGAVLPNGSTKRVTASIGLALFEEAAETGESALARADLAMHQAKESGGDRVAVFAQDTSLAPASRSRIAWIERISDALDADDFSLFAQPIIDLSTKEISRYELLLRMHEGDNVVGPAEFLHVAERNDLAGRIDAWVTGRAISLLADGAIGEHAQIEVNLSGYSLADDTLLNFLSQRFSETGADPSRLVFEVAETAAVSNIALARDFAEAVSEIGCKFALDDFGAGFGSFSYLKHLPFDYVKIDGEFVASCLVSATDRLIIESIVMIATGLGKQTVAEHVADGHTMRFLERLGVDFAQGYHIGRPEPLEKLLQQLAAGDREVPPRWEPST